MNRFGLICLLSLVSTIGYAYQDPMPVKKAAEDFLRIQTRGLPGTATFTVGSIDPSNQLQPCSSFLVKHDNGRLWGRTNLTVQCQSGASWSIYVPVQVKIQGSYLVIRRNLGAGQILTEADIEVRQGDLTEFPGNLLDNPQQALGKTLNVSLIAGQPLRTDALRLPLIIQQGQRITVISRGNGFSVSSEGQALSGASEEQVVRARLPNGQIVSGIAKPGGIVEITN